MRHFFAIIFLVLASASNAQETPRRWSWGGFVDAAYLYDSNHPDNHLFRSRGTAYKVDEPIINMAGAYLRTIPSESSRWGAELTLHAGQDSQIFGFSATAPNLSGYRVLRHLGPANVSYLAPVGKGLTVQGGIFTSFIGYESLYAKDNFNYTRSWAADFTPYLMLGVNASYPFTEKLTGSAFLVNGYWHLADANDVPSLGGQLAYKPAERVTVKQTVLAGPHQSDTAFEFWRFLSDTIVEWKSEKTTIAFNYHAGTENVPGAGRALWMAAHLPLRRTLTDRWSVSLRPELYWDRNGRTTTFRQTVKALTSTVEYRVPNRRANMILRLEHRIDDSRGSDGGFFKDGGLAPTQNLLIFAAIWTIDRGSGS
jgi:hypothetical protein